MLNRVAQAMKRVSFALIRTGRVPAEVVPLQKFQEYAYLLGLLKSLDVDCVLDVGANRGFYAQNLREGGFKGHILSFEPIRANCDHIDKLAVGDDRWKSVSVALGATEGVRQFNVIESGSQNVLSSFLTFNGDDETSTKVEDVMVRRLDSILPELLPAQSRRRIYLKMDTQGYDLEVFKGSQGVLGDVVALQSEISVRPIYDGMPHYTDALQVYEQAGFSVMNLFVVNRTAGGAVLEYDCLMARDVS